MKHSRTRILPFALTALTLSSLLVGSQALAHKSAAQDAKSMDIVRYANEQVELVDLRIGSNSIKSGIEARASKTPEWLDSVKFNAPPDWHKNLSLTVKNISGKPVIGVNAHIFFKAAGTGQLFGMQFFQDRNLQKEALAQGAEVNLVVNPRTWEHTKEIMKQRGADPDLAAVSLEVDIVMFTEDTQWYRGIMVCRDPVSPNTWLAASCKR